jgi:tight adherence protein B
MGKNERSNQTGKIKKSRVIKKTILLSVLLTISIAYVFYQSYVACSLFPMVFFFVRRMVIEEEKKKELLKEKEMFRDFILSLAAALEAGYAVETAMGSVKEELKMLYGEESRIVKECEGILQKMGANYSVENALEEAAQRMKIEDAMMFAETFKIGKRIGGDMNQIIMDTSLIISEKIDTEKEIESSLAAKRFEFRIMCMMPFMMMSYVRLSSPDYFSTLYHTFFGVVTMSVVLIMMSITYLLAKTIIQIKV